LGELRVNKRRGQIPGKARLVRHILAVPFQLGTQGPRHKLRLGRLILVAHIPLLQPSFLQLLGEHKQIGHLLGRVENNQAVAPFQVVRNQAELLHQLVRNLLA